MNYIKRSPEVSVSIVRPDYSSQSCDQYQIVTFVSYEVSEEDKAKAGDKKNGPRNYQALSDALLSYSYTESLYNVDSPFSLSLVPEADKNGLTWIDKIALMDLVFISEFGKPRYCGLVHQVRYSARMGQDGPARAISVSGNGFGELLKSFQLTMDPRLWLGKTVDLANANIQEKAMAKDTTIGSVMAMFYDDFLTIVSENTDENAQAPMRKLLEGFIDKSELATSYVTRIPVAAPLYQHGVNCIWDIWQRIIPAPYGELFGRWDSSLGKYKVIARLPPYDSTDWSALPVVDIDPLVLTDYDVGLDDSDVKTCFYATAPSLGYTDAQMLVVDNYKNAVLSDKKKWSKYGYRPLATTLPFLMRGEDNSGILNELEKVSKQVKDWFSANDAMLSGSISLISIDDKDVTTYAIAGGKIRFLGGEFYVEQVERKWSYGDSPRTNLKVTRGYLYTSSGAMSGPIEGLGKRMLEIEKATSQYGGG